MSVCILRPTNALKRGLLHLEADPLPVQFTSMTGTAGSAPGRPSIGGVLGGDWNAAGNLPPLKPHFPAKTPTWIRINGHENMLDRDPEESNNLFKDNPEVAEEMKKKLSKQLKEFERPFGELN